MTFVITVPRWAVILVAVGIAVQALSSGALLVIQLMYGG